MNNINETSIIFTKSGLLKLDLKNNKESVLLEEVKPKFGNKMGFLIYLFDLQVEIEDGATFNDVLQNLKFFEKELEVLFSEMKMPKNNFAAQKLFEILNSLNRENSDFLDIWNEEKKILDNSLLRNHMSSSNLKILNNKKEFSKKETIIKLKKIVSEKKTFIFNNDENIKEVDKRLSVITKSKLYVNDEQVELSEVHPILLLSAKVSIDYNADVNYIMLFEDFIKCLFKDFWIFRSKEEIKYWKEEINKYYPFYAKNVIYLNEFKNFLRSETMTFKGFGKGDVNKENSSNKTVEGNSAEENLTDNSNGLTNNVLTMSSYRSVSQNKKILEEKGKFGESMHHTTRFHPRYITQEEVNKMMKLIEEKPEMMKLFNFGLNEKKQDVVNERKLKVISSNNNVTSKKSVAKLKRIK